MTLAEQATLTFVVLVSIFGLGILAWGLWVGLWSLYDAHMQNSRRIKNRRIDAAHITGQFYTPTFSQRDFK